MPYKLNKRKTLKQRAHGALALGWQGTKVAAKGTVVTLPMLAWGGFWAFRLYVRKEVRKGLMEEYQLYPNIMGNVFYVAVYGKMPPGKVEEIQAEFLVRTLGRQIVPIFSLKIPTKESIGLFIENRLKNSNLGLLLASFGKLWDKMAGKGA